MKTIILIIFFLLLGAFFIISNENIKLNSQENVFLFFETYSNWLNKLTDNTKTFSGYLVKMQWLPDEEIVDE